MSRKKSLKTAASTFAVALGIGFVMQYGDAVASRFSPDEQVAAPDIILPEMVIPTDVAAASSLALPDVEALIPDDEVIVLAALNDVAAPVLGARV